MKVSPERTLSELVADNYVYAYALNYLGIQFYNYRETTLEEVCRHRGLNQQAVMEQLGRIEREAVPDENKLYAFSVEVIMEYLRYTHFLFVRDRLPYLASLVEALDPARCKQPELAHDLQQIFPEFIKDFIKHLYYEEDVLFSYIRQLHEGLEQWNPNKANALLKAINSHSIQKFALDHSMQDDEMEGIRALTNNYTLPPKADVHMQVVYAELEGLERDLVTHAMVEDRILLPRALQMEREVQRRVSQLKTLN